MKQTAVEWLHEEYMRILKDNDISVLQAFEILDKYNQAKQMEKEQKGYTEEQAKQIWKAGQEYWKTSGSSITFEELIETLIHQREMTREEKLETIVKLFAKIMFYGEWKWETPNERVITMLMQEVGMYPFKDEDEMISKTSVSKDLYQKTINEITSNTKREMKQTAVEWLQEQYYESEGKLTRQDFEQAKKMEEEQSMKAYKNGYVVQRVSK
jgi:hypothetical protein